MVISLLMSPAAALAADGSSLALRSSGAANGTAWVLERNGYVGTYVTLATPATVSFSIDAAGETVGGVAARMNLAVADSKVGWDVAAASATYSTSLSLPAGTHFVRTELANGSAGSGRNLTVQNLTVSGATISNTSSNANALNAASTYIEHFRKGSAHVSLVGATPGTQVQVQLARHAFSFGSAIPGNSGADVQTYLATNPAPGSTAASFQQRLNANFNTIVPENAGKWGNNASSSSTVTMAAVDRVLDYAQSNNMRARMHNLIWGNQQPTWVNTLLTSAASGNAADAATLRSAITNRVNYYVRDRASRYVELDVYNESVHTPQYVDAYGMSGVAGIYDEVASAVAAAGSSARLFTNEYNVLQDSSDAYADWYRQHVSEIRAAGGDVSGIGFQYYSANATGSANNQHNPARMYAAMQNLAVEGLPLALTEYGVKTGGTGTTAQRQARAAQIIAESARLVFGMPEATGFTMWGFWADAVWDGAPEGVLYNADWTTRPAGTQWQDLMTFDADGVDDDWTTSLALPVAADGTIDFRGFYGDYLLTIDGRTYPLSLVKGTTEYSIAVPEPHMSVCAVFAAATSLLMRRRRRAITTRTRRAAGAE
jgi:endo-1,4-beta-xylanase